MPRMPGGRFYEASNQGTVSDLGFRKFLVYPPDEMLKRIVWVTVMSLWKLRN